MLLTALLTLPPPLLQPATTSSNASRLLKK
jgi:hypothetical protein